MSAYEYKKPIDDRINRQTTIDFDEQKRVADQYKVANPDMIEKRGDTWYMVGDTMTVAEWDALQNTDDLPYYTGQK